MFLKAQSLSFKDASQCESQGEVTQPYSRHRAGHFAKTGLQDGLPFLPLLWEAWGMVVHDTWIRLAQQFVEVVHVFSHFPNTFVRSSLPPSLLHNQLWDFYFTFILIEFILSKNEEHAKHEDEVIFSVFCLLTCIFEVHIFL